MANDRERAQMTGPKARELLRGPLGALPIMLGIVAGLVLCGFGLVALNSSAGGRPPDPSTTVDSICADLSTQKYDDLYSRLAPALQQQGNQAQFVASQRELDVLLGPVTSCKHSETWYGNDVAHAAITLERKNEAGSSITLAYKQSEWSIVDFDKSF
ncbi:MAG TPA: hypothetical protein VF792_08910 [Ktedonobacterales bacterium]